MAQLQATDVTGTLTTTGAVGISTTAAPGTFNVLGTSYFSDDIYLRDGAVAAGDVLVRIYDSSDDGVIDVYRNNSVVNRIHGNSVSYFNAGSVGIGTATPTQKFHVDNGASSVYALIGGQNRALYLGQDGTGAAIYSSGNAPMYFSTNDLERMRIDAGGNVGIGITNPLAMLDIDGNSTATNLILRSRTGSDFANLTYTDDLGTTQLMAIGNASGNLRILVGSGLPERMRITSGGDVGIGLTNPGATFVVGAQSSGQAGSGYESDNSIVSRFGASNSGRRMIGLTIANTAAATVGNDASLSFIVASNYSATGIISTILQNTGTAYSDMTFSVYNGSGNPERMRINGVAGNVGIGNTNPSRKLDVLEGNVQIVANFQNTSTTSSRIKFTDANTGAENVNIGATGTSLAMWTNNAVRMTILSGGNVGIGTTAPIRDLMIGDLSSVSTATPKTFSLGGTYSNTAGSNVKLRVYEEASTIGGMSVSGGQMEVNTWSSGKIAFYRGTTQTMIIDSSGNLGINTATPTHKLHVNGNLRVDNLGSSPASTEGPPPETYVGSDSYWLGRPAEWLAINVSGTDYVIPLYSTG